MEVKMIADLIRKNRSCRRFYQNREVDLETLKGLINLGSCPPRRPTCSHWPIFFK